MQKTTSLILHLILAVIVIVELTGRYSDNINLEYYVKPLIMIWMAIYFLIFRKKEEFTLPVLAAFFFSWIGDNFLMFSGKDEIFFFAGVGGFFFAQLSYIYVFTKYSEQGGRGFLQRNLIFGFLFIAYALGIFWLLYPSLEGIMKLIILIYALSLMGMSMMALNRHTRVNHSSFLLVFIGSVLFVISDTMLALDKFYLEFWLAGFWIMFIYIAAQYLIMRGLILEK
jgi:uncharacterized membrane protein YhhN